MTTDDALYSPEIQAILASHGVRIGSELHLLLEDESRWQGWLLPPPPGSDDGFVYLIDADGYGCGIDVMGIGIRTMTEQSYRIAPEPVRPPLWQLPPQETLQQRSLFQHMTNEERTSDAVHIIECGESITAHIQPPGASSGWKEAIDAQCQGMGPLVYQTALQQAIPTPDALAGQPGQSITQQVQAAIARKARGIVCLVALETKNQRERWEAYIERAWPHPLPCPAILLCNDQLPGWSDRGAQFDALKAAVFAARYIDIGEPVWCRPMATLEANAPNGAVTPTKGHRMRAPWGSYHFVRNGGSQQSLAQLHRGILRHQTLNAQPLAR